MTPGLAASAVSTALLTQPGAVSVVQTQSQVRASSCQDGWRNLRPHLAAGGGLLVTDAFPWASPPFSGALPLLTQPCALASLLTHSRSTEVLE